MAWHLVTVKVGQPLDNVQRNAPAPVVPHEMTLAVVLDLAVKVTPIHVLHDKQASIILLGGSQESANPERLNFSQC